MVIHLNRIIFVEQRHGKIIREREEKWIGGEFSVHARAFEIEGPTLFDISTDSNVNRYGVRLKCASRVRLKCASVVKTLNSSIAVPSHSRFFPRFSVSMDTSRGAYFDFHRNISTSWIAKSIRTAIICEWYRKLSCNFYHSIYPIPKVYI